MPSDPRFEVQNEQIKSRLRDIGNILERALPKGWGFTLQMFSYGENGSMFYLSSAAREDMIRLMEEFIKKQREEPEDATDNRKPKS
jgi:hypothetical protein